MKKQTRRNEFPAGLTLVFLSKSAHLRKLLISVMQQLQDHLVVAEGNRAYTKNLGRFDRLEDSVAHFPVVPVEGCFVCLHFRLGNKVESHLLKHRVVLV